MPSGSSQRSTVAIAPFLIINTVACWTFYMTTGAKKPGVSRLPHDITDHSVHACRFSPDTSSLLAKLAMPLLKQHTPLQK
jgi:hypothetical protein